jgi:ABC-2 type transport system ATP-binding protein
MNVVELRNVSKRFDNFIAVRDLSFEVRKGTIFGLLGPNGAGKTTTIRMIVNIFAPDEGEIKVMDRHISSELQQHIGYLPEERGLYKKMEVGDQLVFFASLKGVDSAEAARRVDHWLGRLELSDWKKKKAQDLSKGMQQKVQFIATVLHDPDLLILDEPFSGLDPVSTNLLKEIILDLKNNGQDDNILDPPDGAGRADVRRHMPHKPRHEGAGREPPRSQGALRAKHRHPRL